MFKLSTKAATAAVISSVLLLSACGNVADKVTGNDDSAKGQLKKVSKDLGISEASRVIVNNSRTAITFAKDGKYVNAQLNTAGDGIDEDEETDAFIATAPIDDFDVNKLQELLNDKLSSCEEAKRVAAIDITPTGEKIQELQCQTGFISASSKAFDADGNEFPSFNNWSSKEAIEAVLSEAKKYGGTEVVKFQLTNASPENNVDKTFALVDFKPQKCTNGELCETTYTRFADLNAEESVLDVSSEITPSDAANEATLDISNLTAETIINTIAKAPRKGLRGDMPASDDLSTLVQIQIESDRVTKKTTLNAVFSDKSRISDAELQTS